MFGVHRGLVRAAGRLSLSKEACVRKLLSDRSRWRTGVVVAATAAALGIAAGSVPALAGGLFGSPPDPRDVAGPPGPAGEPGFLTELRRCPGPNGTTNWVFLTLAPEDTPVSENPRPVVAANLACGPEDRVR